MIIQLLGSPMVAAPLRAQSKLRFCSIYPPLPWRHPPPGLFQRSFAAVPFELFSYAGAFYLFGEQDLYHSDPWRRHFSHLPNDAVEVPVDLGSQTWSTKRPTNGFLAPVIVAICWYEWLVSQFHQWSLGPCCCHPGARLSPRFAPGSPASERRKMHIFGPLFVPSPQLAHRPLPNPGLENRLSNW